MTAKFADIFTELIAFNTISSQSNLDCIDYIASLLQKNNFRTKKIYNAEKNKANLLASIGPDCSGGIILSGHTDVVPVADQNWETDPFILTKKDNCWYGRGTADMKGFIALLLELATQINIEQLTRPLHFVFTYDEEVGCLGAKALADEITAFIPKPYFALIGEPTNLDFVTAHKGIQVTHTQITGQSAHSSQPALGVSAILTACEFMTAISNNLPQEIDDKFTPEHSTCNFGVIKGGSAVNIIPEHCELDWEIRPLPMVDMQQFNDWREQLEQQLNQRHEALKINSTIKANVPALQSMISEEVVKIFKKLMPEQIITTAAFVTEAGIFEQYGIPTIVCGPGHVKQAHQPNEYVSDKQIITCRQFLKSLLAFLE